MVAIVFFLCSPLFGRRLVSIFLMFTRFGFKCSIFTMLFVNDNIWVENSSFLVIYVQFWIETIQNLEGKFFGFDPGKFAWGWVGLGLWKAVMNMYPRIMSPNWGGLKLVELTACCGSLCTPRALYPLLFCKDDVKVLPMFCTNFHILGSGFKYVVFLFLLGEDSHFDWYFSDGLKPPTSISLSGALLNPPT